jgi:hypothetical protein
MLDDTGATRSVRRLQPKPAQPDGWTPRKRFETALRGEMPDRIPAVLWNNKLPGDDTDQALLDAGTCIVFKSSVYDVEYEGVEIETEQWIGEEGLPHRRKTYHTPCGRLEELDIIYPDTIWHQKLPFRSTKDYDALIALIDSQRYTPRYDRFLEHDAYYGPSGIARPATEATPMLSILYRMLGVEAFAVEWFDRRDHVMALYNALLDARRRRLPLLAASPAMFFIVEANVAFDIVGPKRFQELYIPPIEEACEILHASGKLAGAHLDSNNRGLAPLVAQTAVDFIESFTPPPDCDMSIAEARQAWPGKALCCNFPSSVHHGGPGAVRARVKELMAEASPGAGFLLGVLENVPRNDTLVPLSEAIWDFGKTPIDG